MNNILSRYKD